MAGSTLVIGLSTEEPPSQPNYHIDSFSFMLLKAWVLTYPKNCVSKEYFKWLKLSIQGQAARNFTRLKKRFIKSPAWGVSLLSKKN